MWLRKSWAALLLVLLVSQSAALAAPPAAPTTRGGSAPAGGVPAPANSLEFDLGSSNRMLPAQYAFSGSGASVTSISNTGGSIQVRPTSSLTAAEFVAVSQVLSSGRQTIQLNVNGAAFGGSFGLTDSLARSMAQLVVPTGVSVIHNFAQTDALVLPGNLTNSGNYYAVSSNPQVVNASISAANIVNQSGALITSVLPSGGLPWFSGTTNYIKTLNLVASANIINSGTISSSGALNLVAGGTITNALPAGTTSGGIGAAAMPSIVAAGDLNLQGLSIFNQGSLISNMGNLAAFTGSLTNSGSILSQRGDVLVKSLIDDQLTVNSTLGDITASGSVVFQTLDLGSTNAKLHITGGNMSGASVIFDSPGGDIDVAANRIDGGVGIYGCNAIVGVAEGDLRIASQVLTADPIYSNASGNLDLSGLFSGPVLSTGGLGAQFVALAGGNITADFLPGISVIDASNLGIGSGGNIVFAAGVNFTIDGGGLYTIGTPSGTGGNVDVPLISFLTNNDGAISVQAHSGSKSSGSVSFGDATSNGNITSGGAVNVTANDRITVGNMLTSGAPGANSRNVVVSTTSGIISIGNIYTAGADSVIPGGAGGMGGAVTVTAGLGNVVLGTIDTHGGRGSDATLGGGAGGSAGDVNVQSNNGILSVSSITASGGWGGIGTSGNGGKGGDSGRVTLVANNGGSDIHVTGSVEATGGQGGLSLLANGGVGGDSKPVVLTAAGSIVVDDFIVAGEGLGGFSGGTTGFAASGASSSSSLQGTVVGLRGVDYGGSSVNVGTGQVSITETANAIPDVQFYDLDGDYSSSAQSILLGLSATEFAVGTGNSFEVSGSKGSIGGSSVTINGTTNLGSVGTGSFSSSSATGALTINKGVGSQTIAAGSSAYVTPAELVAFLQVFDGSQTLSLNSSGQAVGGTMAFDPSHVSNSFISLVIPTAVAASSTMDLSAFANVDIQSGASLAFGSGLSVTSLAGSFTNAGTLSGNQLAITSGSDFGNTGAVSGIGLSFDVGGQLFNSGTIDSLGAGSITIDAGTLVNAGVISSANGMVDIFTSALSLGAGSGISGSNVFIKATGSTFPVSLTGNSQITTTGGLGAIVFDSPGGIGAIDFSAGSASSLTLLGDTTIGSLLRMMDVSVTQSVSLIGNGNITIQGSTLDLTNNGVIDSTGRALGGITVESLDKTSLFGAGLMVLHGTKSGMSITLVATSPGGAVNIDNSPMLDPGTGAFSSVRFISDASSSNILQLETGATVTIGSGGVLNVSTPYFVLNKDSRILSTGMVNVDGPAGMDAHVVVVGSGVGSTSAAITANKVNFNSSTLQPLTFSIQNAASGTLQINGQLKIGSVTDQLVRIDPDVTVSSTGDINVKANTFATYGTLRSTASGGTIGVLADIIGGTGTIAAVTGASKITLNPGVLGVLTLQNSLTLNAGSGGQVKIDAPTRVVVDSGAIISIAGGSQLTVTTPHLLFNGSGSSLKTTSSASVMTMTSVGSLRITTLSGDSSSKLDSAGGNIVINSGNSQSLTFDHTAAGSSTLGLKGGNSFITAPIIIINSGEVISSSKNVTFNTASFTDYGTITTSAPGGSIQISNPNGALTMDGAPGAISVTGAAGTIIVAAKGASALTMNSSYTFSTDAAGFVNFEAQDAGGSVVLPGGVTNAGPGQLKISTPKLSLAGANTYVSGGSIFLNSGNGASDLTVNTQLAGATVTFSASSPTSSISLSPTARQSLIFSSNNGASFAFIGAPVSTTVTGAGSTQIGTNIALTSALPLTVNTPVLAMGAGASLIGSSGNLSVQGTGTNSSLNVRLGIGAVIRASGANADILFNPSTAGAITALGGKGDFDAAHVVSFNGGSDEVNVAVNRITGKVSGSGTPFSVTTSSGNITLSSITSDASSGLVSVTSAGVGSQINVITSAVITAGSVKLTTPSLVNDGTLFATTGSLAIQSNVAGNGLSVALTPGSLLKGKSVNFNQTGAGAISVTGDGDISSSTDVTLGGGTGNVNVAVNTIGGTVTGSGATLVVSVKNNDLFLGALNSAGAMTLSTSSAGNVFFTGNATAGGALIANSGSLGSISVSAGTVVSGSSVSLFTPVLNNDGVLRASTGDLSVQSNGSGNALILNLGVNSQINAPGAGRSVLFNGSGAGSITASSGTGVISAADSVNFNGGSAGVNVAMKSISGNIEGSGSPFSVTLTSGVMSLGSITSGGQMSFTSTANTIRVITGATILGGQAAFTTPVLVNNGMVRTTAGGITVQGSGTGNSLVLTSTVGSSLVAGGPISFNPLASGAITATSGAGLIAADGQVRFNGGSSPVNVVTDVISGQVVGSGTSFIVKSLSSSGSFFVGNVSATNGSVIISSAKNLDVTSATANNGQVNMSAAGTLNVGSGSIIASSGNVILNGTASVGFGSGVSLLAGALAGGSPPTGVLEASNLKSAGSVSVIGGSISIAPSATFTANGGNVIVVASTGDLNAFGGGLNVVANGGNVQFLAAGNITGKSTNNSFTARSLGTSEAFVGGGIEFGAGITSSNAIGNYFATRNGTFNAVDPSLLGNNVVLQHNDMGGQVALFGTGSVNVGAVLGQSLIDTSEGTVIFQAYGTHFIDLDPSFTTASFAFVPTAAPPPVTPTTTVVAAPPPTTTPPVITMIAIVPPILVPTASPTATPVDLNPVLTTSPIIPAPMSGNQPQTIDLSLDGGGVSGAQSAQAGSIDDNTVASSVIDKQFADLPDVTPPNFNNRMQYISVGPCQEYMVEDRDAAGEFGVGLIASEGSVLMSGNGTGDDKAGRTLMLKEGKMVVVAGQKRGLQVQVANGTVEVPPDSTSIIEQRASGVTRITVLSGRSAALRFKNAPPGKNINIDAGEEMVIGDNALDDEEFIPADGVDTQITDARIIIASKQISSSSETSGQIGGRSVRGTGSASSVRVKVNLRAEKRNINADKMAQRERLLACLQCYGPGAKKAKCERAKKAFQDNIDSPASGPADAKRVTQASPAPYANVAKSGVEARAVASTDTSVAAPYRAVANSVASAVGAGKPPGISIQTLRTNKYVVKQIAGSVVNFDQAEVVDLRSGEILVSSVEPTVVKSNNATINIGANSIALISASPDVLIVRNIWDSPGHTVQLTAAGKVNIVTPGQEYILGSRDFTPAKSLKLGNIGRRRVNLMEGEASQKLMVSEISLSSLMVDNPLLRSVRASIEPGDKDIHNRVAKMAVILSMVTAKRGPYQLPSAQR